MADDQAGGRLREALARWEREVSAPDQARRPERKQAFRTDVGLEPKRLYTPADLEDDGFDYLKDLGFPGEFPYTRGITPGMYRTEPAVLRVYSGFGHAGACNERFKKLLEWGAEEIVIALDLPTQVGYDSDHDMATGEIGRVGVAIDTLADMEDLFRNIPLNSMKRVSMLGNAIGPIALALFIALGEKQGLSPADFVVDLQNDPLKEYIARGTQILPVRPALQVGVDPVLWCAEHAPHWFPMSVCVNHINAAGAGSSMGTAIALGNALEYFDYMVAKGYRIDQVAPLVSMFLDERHDFFVAVANFRATRRIWARLLQERYGAADPRALALKITAYGHGQETLQEPLNNISRIAYGTLSYVLGGVNYLYNASYDEALSTPNEDTVKVTIRMQQILAQEHGFTDTVDPLAGSYYVESLTNQVERQILDGLGKVLDLGGALAAMEKRFSQSVITEGAVRRQKAIEKGERSWVTVNKWPQGRQIPTGAFRIEQNTGAEQRARLAQVKASRDGARVAATLVGVRAACRSGENLVPPVLEAIRAYATVGEICDVWRAEFGEYQPATDF